MPDGLGLAALIASFTLYLGVLGASGTVLATRVFRLQNTRNIALWFAALGGLAALLGFSIKGAELTGSVSGLYDTEMLGLLWGTPVGTALRLCLFGLSTLIIGHFLGHVGAWISLVGSLIAISSFTQIGHIAGLENLLLQLALLVHLFAVAFWIGILIPLKRAASNPKTYEDAATLGHRFGKVATFTVPLLIVLGVMMGYQLIGSWSGVFTTSYGQVLLIKIAFVALLLGLAALNKLRYVPQLKAGDPSSAQGLVRSISLEWLVIVSVLALTAFLTTNVTLPA